LEEVAAESLAEQELAFQLQPLEQQVLAQRGPEQPVLAQLAQALVLVPEQVLALGQQQLEQLQLEHLVMLRHLRLEQVRFPQQRRYLLELKSSLIYRQQVMEFQYRLYRLRPLITVHRVQLDHLRLLASGLQFPQLRSHRELASLLKMTFSLNAPLLVSNAYSNEQSI
jgi:hypothetical protein